MKSLIFLIAFICTGCQDALTDFVAGAIPNSSTSSCASQFTTGKWVNVANNTDVWTFKPDCSGSDSLFGYQFDTFSIQPDGVSAIMNLIGSKNIIDLTLMAPRTYTCTLNKMSADEFILTCGGMAYRLRRF